MTTYYALTSTNPQQGWSPLAATGTDKAAVTAHARTLIGDIRTDYGTDLERETEHKNLIVVPASKLRDYGWSKDGIEQAISEMD